MQIQFYPARVLRPIPSLLMELENKHTLSVCEQTQLKRLKKIQAIAQVALTEAKMVTLNYKDLVALRLIEEQF